MDRQLVRWTDGGTDGRLAGKRFALKCRPGLDPLTTQPTVCASQQRNRARRSGHVWLRVTPLHPGSASKKPGSASRGAAMSKARRAQGGLARGQEHTQSQPPLRAPWGSP